MKLVSVPEPSGRISRAVLVDGHDRIDPVRDQLGRPENNRPGEVYPLP